MGRDAAVDPIEVPEGNAITIGSTPLLMMDWVMDMRDHRLIGNPAHGGEQVLEMYWPAGIRLHAGDVAYNQRHWELE